MKKIIISSIVILGFLSCNNKQKESETTSDAQKETYFSMDNLDSTVSPCDNFYQFAIGGWLKDNPVPSTESRWSSFNVVNDSNNIKLKKILIEFSSQENEKGSMEQKIGDFYTSIMDSSKADQLGISPLDAEFEKINAVESIPELIILSAHHKSIGVNSLFGIYIGQDDKNSEAYITHIYQSGLGLPDRDYYLKKDDNSVKIQQSYIANISAMLTLSGKENSEETANVIYSIEKSLAEISMTRVERRDPDKTYNKYVTNELKTLSDQIDWESYFSAVGLTDVESVVVSQPEFIKGLNHYLKDIKLEDWKNYFSWRLLDTYASHLSSEFVNQDFSFYGTTLSGTKEMKPRWKRALAKTNGNIGQLVGKAFVERHFSEEAKKDVSQMVENLKDVFRERINGLSWMSDETKLKAIEKLNSFDKKIGYPDKWRNYDALDIVADNQIQNIIESSKFNFNYMMNKLGKDVDRDEWFMTPQTVNAYYSSSKNEIVFPAGILQSPFYSPNADDALNYGGIGAVIGHEFTHGFDDQGSKYDSKGNLENWWTENDRTKFDGRANKVVEQFNSFEPIDSLFVNGKLTLGENIADLGGATLAFYALEKELEKVGKPTKIDGFTYQQRFFLGWAQVWHMNMTDEELRKRIATDSHSPGEYRVIGPLANMDEFKNAFGCVEGDAMVNTDSTKALIW